LSTFDFNDTLILVENEGFAWYTCLFLILLSFYQCQILKGITILSMKKDKLISFVLMQVLDLFLMAAIFFMPTSC